MRYANCLTYLHRRGALPFRAAPFCPVDGLILSMCAYAPFGGILPGRGEAGWLSFTQGAARLVRRPGWDRTGPLMARQIPDLVLQAAESPRFRGVKLGEQEEILDGQTQFAALTYALPDGTLFLAFRGTDDTLVGWKECFSMSYSPAVPAQRLALDYVRQVAGAHRGKLRLGGHSKGGNLAMYAALHAPADLRRRILTVCSYDGPGFGQDLTQTRPYRALAGRMTTFVPQTSLVGTLLHQDPRAKTVKSHGRGLVRQHDPFTWEVRGTSFLTLPRPSRRGQREAAGFRGWVNSMAPEEREEFTDVFFQLLAAPQAETLSDLTRSWTGSVLAMAGAYRRLEPALQRDMLGYVSRFVRNMVVGGG